MVIEAVIPLSTPPQPGGAVQENRHSSSAAAASALHVQVHISTSFQGCFGQTQLET